MNYDILFHIGLYTKFKKSVAIISSCKTLWDMRQEFYNRKHLIYYNKPILNFWSPEQHFYASGSQFSSLITNITMYMEISYLYEYNNTVRCIKKENDYDYMPILQIENQWLVIWYTTHYNNHEGIWSYNFYAFETDLLKVIKNTIVEEGYVKYSVIDLKKLNHVGVRLIVNLL